MSLILRTYWQRVLSFHPNARAYLLSAIFSAAVLGVYRLLFNFYVLSLHFDEGLLGNLITVTNLSALFSAVPMGYLADMLGRKRSLLLGGFFTSLSIAAMLAWPNALTFYAMNALLGIAQSLSAVTMSPFLLENSGEEERTYLFSLSSGLQMAAASLGNAIGGYLPGVFARRLQVTATSPQAYAATLTLITAGSFLSLLPLFWLRAPRQEGTGRNFFAPFAYAQKHPAILAKLITPMLITSIGAGLFMPFMNVFFRVVHHQPDPVIGNILAWGTLAMGLGLLIAPPLADRIGKGRLVVFTQGLSIPFLALLGFAPWLWLSALGHYIRLALMNMSGPIYQTFVMEHVEPDSRSTVASLVSMAGNFGWAFSPSISGWLQVQYGFGPVYGLVLLLYSISVFLYWNFWLAPQTRPQTKTAL